MVIFHSFQQCSGQRFAIVLLTQDRSRLGRWGRSGDGQNGAQDSHGVTIMMVQQLISMILLLLLLVVVVVVVLPVVPHKAVAEVSE